MNIIRGEFYLESLWKLNFFGLNNWEIKTVIDNLDNLIADLQKERQTESEFRNFYDLNSEYKFYLTKLIIVAKSIQNDLKNILNEQKNESK